MIQILTIVSTFVLFAVGPSVLNLVGLGYTNGSPILGIHISSYMAIATAAAFAIGNRDNLRTARTSFPLSSAFLLIVCALAIVLLGIRSEIGFRMTVIVVTFVTPALLLFILQNSSPQTLRRVRMFVIGFMIINAGIGIGEFATGQRLIPFTIGLESIDFDPRPTALLSHPLYNALVTGVMLLSLLMMAIRDGAKPLTIAGIGYFTIAMFAFGGRTALVASFGVFALYAIYRAAGAAMAMRLRKDVGRSIFLVAALAAAAPVILASPIAAMTLDRFANSQSSDRTRLVAFDLLNSMNGAEKWIGISTATQASLQNSLGTTRGVEISWIALTLSYGYPIAIALIIGMIWLLWSATRRDRDRAFIGLFFVITTFGSLSIGSRSLLLSQTIVLMLCGPLSYRQERPVQSSRSDQRPLRRRSSAQVPGRDGPPRRRRIEPTTPPQG